MYNAIDSRARRQQLTYHVTFPGGRGMNLPTAGGSTGRSSHGLGHRLRARAGRLMLGAYGSLASVPGLPSSFVHIRTIYKRMRYTPKRGRDMAAPATVVIYIFFGIYISPSIFSNRGR